MASSSGVTTDSLITLKVVLDGSPRRFKLPLRDLGVHSLEKKVQFSFNQPFLDLVSDYTHPSCLLLVIHTIVLSYYFPHMNPLAPPSFA